MALSTPQYVDALSTLEHAGFLANNRLRDLLVAQYGAPEKTITASQMADAVGYQDYRGANLQYGLLARKVAEHVGFQPPKGKNGKIKWFTTLSCGNQPSDETIDGQFEFVMHASLAKAVEQLGWVTQPKRPPYRNRVDPWGNIVAVEARGQWMGNRGILHNDRQQIVRLSAHKAWVLCRLDYKGKRRTIMDPNGYTELFFFDEAVAYAAGHRPCAQCRNKDYKRFKQHWLAANRPGIEGKVEIQEIDRQLHAERYHKGEKVTTAQPLNTLPTGTMFEFDGSAFLVFDGQIYRWHFQGYSFVDKLGFPERVTVLTPPSIVEAFRNGLTPTIRGLSD